MGLAKAVTRVFILANELGVSSKAIVEKCQAENLDIKNHMSTISAGLAATIREWFSEGNHSTTLETAGRVDLEKVRVRRRVRHKEGAETGTVDELTAQAEVSGAETAEETETSPSIPGEAVAVGDSRSPGHASDNRNPGGRSGRIRSGGGIRDPGC